MLQSYNKKNKDLLVNINGKIVHRDQAAISPFDSVVQGGDAVWEGLRLYKGRIFRLQQHLDRLEASAKALAFRHLPDQQWIREQLKATLAANDMTDHVHIRLTWTRGVKVTSGMDPRLNTQDATLIILAEHKSPVYDSNGLSLCTAAVRRIPPDCLDQKIHSCNLINSILAKIEANAAGVDDALMLDYQGFVAETNATHLFFVFDGKLSTPFTTSCPEGVTRSVVMALCAEQGIVMNERNISLAEAYAADEIFCTGTMGELAGVTKIDGRSIADGNIGATTQRLSGLYQAYVLENSEAIDSPES